MQSDAGSRRVVQSELLCSLRFLFMKFVDFFERVIYLVFCGCKDVWNRNGRQYLSSNAGSPRRKALLSRPMIPGVESIIAVASGKGGVGKSTTAGTDLDQRCRIV